MVYSVINLSDQSGYVEMFVPIKVKIVGGYGTEQDLKSNYQSLVDSGEIILHIEEYLLSKVVGEHSIGFNNLCIDKLLIEVGEG